MAQADRARWDARHAEEGPPGEPPRWLLEVEGLLPREGRALDVAAGRGRAGLHLARRGLAVTLVDISPVGLEAAGRAAAAEGLVVDAVCADLEVDPLPPGPFEVIVLFAYRQPALWPALRERLSPGGGLLVAEVALVDNLALSPRPSRRFLAAPGELLDLARPLEILRYREGVAGGRASARLVARRPDRRR